MSPRRAQAVRGRKGDPATVLREHLLETTERLLGEQTPATLTTRRIARAAGVSDGVLYNHFSDKDELVLGAIVRRFSALLERYRSSIAEPGTGSVETNLGRIAEAAFELHLALLPIVAGLLADDLLLRRFLHEIHRNHVGAAETVEALDRHLAAERAAGRLADVDTRAAANLLVGAVAVRAFTTALGAAPAAERDALPALVSTLVRGLEPRS
jgi:AcrR family transcriptional regulator